jgi:hypothetical protein
LCGLGFGIVTGYCDPSVAVWEAVATYWNDDDDDDDDDEHGRLEDDDNDDVEDNTDDVSLRDIAVGAGFDVAAPPPAVAISIRC